MLQYVAARCSVLQCVAVCCIVLLYVAVCCSMVQYVVVHSSALQGIAMYYSVLQSVAVLQGVSSRKVHSPPQFPPPPSLTRTPISTFLTPPPFLFRNNDYKIKKQF